RNVFLVYRSRVYPRITLYPYAALVRSSPDAGAGGSGGATPCGTNDDCHDGDRCTADICRPDGTCAHAGVPLCCDADSQCDDGLLDRKSTRLNSSHVKISYAVSCLKKKT